MRRLRDRWTEFWYGDIDPIRLDAFRLAITYTLIAYVLAWLQDGGEWLTAAGFHPSHSADPATAPRVPLLPQGMLWPVAVAYVGGAVAVVLLGSNLAIRRVALAVVLAGTIYVSAADPIAAFTINRVYTLAFAVLLLAPSPHNGVMVAWPTRVLQATLVIHYFCAGWCKASEDWLASGDVLWGQVQGIYMTDAAAWMVRAFPPWAWAGLQHAALAFELLAPLLFLVRRLRPLALVWGLVMHAVIALTMAKLVFFSAQVVCFYLLFVPPDWLRRLRRR